MSSNGKWAAPKPRLLAMRWPVIERAIEGGITLFSAPAGYFSSDHLASLLAQQGRDVVWLRLGIEDRDPGTLLVSLIQAARVLSPGFGEATLEQMAREPGPIHGWGRHFAGLAREWAILAPGPGALVLQHLELARSTPGLFDLLGAQFLQLLPDSVPRILITHQPLPRNSLPGTVVERGITDLRLDERGAEVLAVDSAIELPIRSVMKMVSLSDGRASAILDFFEAIRIFGVRTVDQILDKSVRLENWMAKIARIWFSSIQVETLQALALALRLGYSHPSLIQVAVGDVRVPPGPWLQELTQGWSRIRCAWKPPLIQALRAGAISEHNSLHQAAQFLAAQGQAELAIPALLELGDLDGAGEAVASSAEQWMSRGQWQMLADWIGELPLSALENWPWLIYFSGEIIAAQGHIDTARRTFAKARQYFEGQGDQEGLCRAMLAENTLAARQDDLAFAQKSALAVLSIAQHAEMDQIACWASWQAGCLAVVKDQMEAAVEYFAQASLAAQNAGDDAMIQLCGQAEGLARALVNLQKQTEHYQQAYFESQKSSFEASQQLRLLLSDPLHGILLPPKQKQKLPPDLFPIILKIPDQSLAKPFSFDPVRRNLVALLIGTLGMIRRKWAPNDDIPLPSTSKDVPQKSWPPRIGLSPSNGERIIPETGSQLAVQATKPPTDDGIDHRNIESAPIFEIETEDLSGDGEMSQDLQPEGLRLSAHLLGPLNVSVNDQRIVQWPSNKCRSVFSYLLAHHHHPITRDILMDVFWPEASLKAARNNLNVALHGLRRTLRSVSGFNLVEYRAGAYCVSPGVELWLDIDEFERQVQEGHQCENLGQQEMAVKAYEAAAGLYQGDFLADDLYEEWPITLRQHLRLAYQEILDRLSQNYYQVEQFVSCISMCQIILSFDNCREDIHCRLMRCFSRQGLAHLALRQYQICESALQAELQVAPSQSTVQLYEQIRRHRDV